MIGRRDAARPVPRETSLKVCSAVPERASSRDHVQCKLANAAAALRDDTAARTCVDAIMAVGLD